jgi:hypothetical protein
MKAKIITSAIALAILTSVTLFAVDRADIREETREGIEKVMKDKVHPKKVEWKETIDKNITKDDKAKLDKIRTEVHTLLDEGFEKRKELYCNETYRGEHRAERMNLRDDQHDKFIALLDDLRDIMQKYEDMNDKIRDERDDLQHEVRKEVRDVFETVHDKYKDELDEYGYGRGNHNSEGYGKGRGMRGYKGDGLGRGAGRGERDGYASNRQLSMPAIWLFNGEEQFIPGRQMHDSRQGHGRGQGQGRRF